MVVLVVVVALLFLSGGGGALNPFAQRPAPPPAPRTDYGALGVQGGADLVTGNVPGAAVTVYKVFSNPAVQKNTVNAASGAFHAATGTITHAASSALHTLESLNPF